MSRRFAISLIVVLAALAPAAPALAGPPSRMHTGIGSFGCPESGALGVIPADGDPIGHVASAGRTSTSGAARRGFTSHTLPASDGLYLVWGQLPPDACPDACAVASKHRTRGFFVGRWSEGCAQ